MFCTRSTLAVFLVLVLPFSVSGVSAQSSTSGPGIKLSPAFSSTNFAATRDRSPAGLAVSGGTAPPRVGPFSRIGVGMTVGMLGIGLTAATPIARDLNVGGGANFFSYSRSFGINNINYAAKLDLRSVAASLDFFPWAKGFHVNPRAIRYNGISLDANAGEQEETFRTPLCNFLQIGGISHRKFIPMLPYAVAISTLIPINPAIPEVTFEPYSIG